MRYPRPLFLAIRASSARALVRAAWNSSRARADVRVTRHLLEFCNHRGAGLLQLRDPPREVHIGEILRQKAPQIVDRVGHFPRVFGIEGNGLALIAQCAILADRLDNAKSLRRDSSQLRKLKNKLDRIPPRA